MYSPFVWARFGRRMRNRSKACATRWWRSRLTVDPHEAELLSLTAHTMSRRLAREYGVTWDPAIHNFLIHIGAKQRGICADYTRDIGARLKEFHFKTLVLHWGAA